MLLILKLFIYILSGISTLLTLLIQLVWHDKRTIKYKRLRRLLILVTLISYFCGVFILCKDHKTSSENNLNLNNKIDSLIINSAHLKETYDSLDYQLDSILIHLDNFDSILNPFYNLAAKRYPNLDSNKALEKLRNEITININQHFEQINAPNALIATNNQIGNNTVVNPIVELPPANVNWEWQVINKPVTSIPNIRRKREIIQLPSDDYPYKTLYHNRILIKYYSKVARGEFLIGLMNKDVKSYTIEHMGVNFNSSGFTDTHFVIRLSQPENGEYVIDYYTLSRLSNLKNELAFQ